jgi:AmiR/NasT family two-component response regulator
MSATPSFIGQKALILHRAGDTTERLARRLGVLGLRVEVAWAASDFAGGGPDLVLVDADAGWNGLLPWASGDNPMPLIALLGSEAPGRIGWAIEQGANAMIAKPVAPSAVFPALVMAMHHHAALRCMAERVANLEERVRLRPLVVRALQAIITERGCDEATAHRQLRREAMRSRLTLEQVAAAILAGTHDLPAVG